GWAAGRIPVFAVPGDVDRAHVAGCLALIRDGAILARTPQDVADDLRLSAPPPARESRAFAPVASDPLQHRLQRLLRSGERSLDELLAETGESPAQVLEALSMLELSGAIETLPGG